MTVIFPFYTQDQQDRRLPRSEYQFACRWTTTNTYHICYQVYAAPPGVTAPDTGCNSLLLHAPEGRCRG